MTRGRATLDRVAEDRTGEKISVRLFGNLMPFGRGRSGTWTLPLGSARTVAELLAHLGIPRFHVGMVLINNARTSDFARSLQAGDEVKIFGLMAGG